MVVLSRLSSFGQGVSNRLTRQYTVGATISTGSTRSQQQVGFQLLNVIATSTTGNNEQSQQQQNYYQLIQQRYRWTKAKKKRFARYERHQEFERLGKSLPKPPYYMPKDTKVVNAYSKEERIQESKVHDEKASALLRDKLSNAAVQQNQTLRFHMRGVTMSDRVRKLFELRNGNQKEVVQAQKQLGMEIFQLRDGDTGSSAVQVIALTTRIQQLQTHMSKHKKDKHSKRGMDALYVRRRKLLDYMERKDFDTYRKVVKTLGLIR